MRAITQFDKLKQFQQRPLFHAWEARKAGINPPLLSYYVRKGLLERIDRGIYRMKGQSLEVDFRWGDLILVVKSIPEGVVCLISALSLYGLTEEIPREYWIAVPNTSKAPKRKGAKVVRMRNMQLGRTKMKIGNETIQIFDKERTIIDAFRYLGKETAIKALKAVLSKVGTERVDLKKLQDYGKKLRVKIDPYLLAVTI